MQNAMQITYSAEPSDRPIYEAAAERPGLPLKIRLQPTIYRKRASGPGGTAQAWPGVSWILACASPEEALAVKDALRAFFTRLAIDGPEATRDRLVSEPPEGDPDRQRAFATAPTAPRPAR